MSKNKKESNSKSLLNEKSQKKIRHESGTKIQMKIKQKLSLPEICPSTEKLRLKIDHFKKQQTQITKTLEQAIKSNLKFRSNSASELQKAKNLQFVDKKHNLKQKSLVSLKKNFQKRIQFNIQANINLQKMQQEITLKKQAVGRKLSLIQAHNFQKIKQIEQFEKSFLAQVKAEMHKNFQKQKKLKMQYDKIQKEDSKIKTTKQHENRLDQETWKQIMNLKLNLQGMMVNQKKRQNRLISQKNVELFKKQEKMADLTQQGKKIEAKRVKLNPKEAGRQYLDFAKKKGSLGSKSQNKLRKDYLNINLKVINYDSPILDVISNNDGSLSKKIQNQGIIYKDNQNYLKVKSDQYKIQNWNKQVNENENDTIPILQQRKQDSLNEQFSEIDGIEQVQNVQVQLKYLKIDKRQK